MKNSLWFFLLAVNFLFTTNVLAQASDNINRSNGPSDVVEVKDVNWKPIIADSICENPDVSPVMPGCENADDVKICFQRSIMDFIIKNFKYPISAIKSKEQGRVAVEFKIDIDGKVKQIQAFGPYKSLCEASIKIFKKMPTVQPALKNGEKVAIQLRIPVSYRVQ
ncbi:energy transducer TonB [Zhouia sp. PK063]|uniref:energy transducer TonB n=1 Tax=Zhouia sp. PK063 TaxID=3373602 RepID=UPI0037938941